MNRVGNWLQIIGNIAVLVGLIFVGMQLIQDRDLKEAELVFAHYAETEESLRAQLGEEPLKSIAKLNWEPEDLTDYDILVVYAELRLQMTVWERLSRMEALGLQSGDWRDRVGLGEDYWGGGFGSPLGKRMLKESLNYPNALAPEFKAKLLQALEGVPSAPPNTSVTEYYDYLRGEEYPRK